MSKKDIFATQVSDKTVLEDYQHSYPQLTNQEARSDLGAFLFSGDEVNKKTLVLSGGEVVRLSLCKLFKTRPNFLILDEPTNHMDIYSKERIEDMLKAYKGTLLFVSHDRYFVRKVATSLLVLENNTATYYPYGYEQYLTKRVNTSSKEEPIYKEKVKKQPTDKTNYKKELTKLEKEIKEYEEKIAKINLEFEKEEVYTDFLISRELEEQLEILEDDLAILMGKWEEIVNMMED